jgi:hypothetical protein
MSMAIIKKSWGPKSLSLGFQQPIQVLHINR